MKLKVKNRKILSTEELPNGNLQVKVLFNIAKIYTLYDKPYEYDSALLGLLNKKTKPNDKLHSKNEHTFSNFDSYNTTQPDKRCLHCKNIIKAINTYYANSEFAQVIFYPLISRGHLKLKLCTNCIKAYKVFPPTDKELEGYIKMQLKTINRFIKANEDLCQRLYKTDINTITLTCR